MKTIKILVIFLTLFTFSSCGEGSSRFIYYKVTQKDGTTYFINEYPGLQDLRDKYTKGTDNEYRDKNGKIIITSVTKLTFPEHFTWQDRKKAIESKIVSTSRKNTRFFTADLIKEEFIFTNTGIVELQNTKTSTYTRVYFLSLMSIVIIGFCIFLWYLYRIHKRNKNQKTTT